MISGILFQTVKHMKKKECDFITASEKYILCLRFFFRQNELLSNEVSLVCQVDHYTGVFRTHLNI